MFKKKKNYKLLIGLIVGFVISISLVYASTYYGAASDLSYDNSTSGLSSSNVQDALDELYGLTCPNGYYCEKYKTSVDDLELGDYVSYTPTIASFTTDKTKTNYTSTQTIYPNKLKLWRVLNIYEDGTVDLISEYVSGTSVYFRGLIGYQNLVGYLNELASKYETEGITIRSRHFGYDEHNNPQTEYITDTQYFVNPAPWECSTGASCTPDPDDYEEYGGGDTGYLTDYNQVYTVLGTRVAYGVGTITAASYWMASRYYSYNNPSNYLWIGRVIDANGNDSTLNMYYYSFSRFVQNLYTSRNLRPIVTLKSGLSYTGLGTEENPVVIVG